MRVRLAFRPLNTSMLRPISATECLSHIELLLTADELGRTSSLSSLRAAPTSKPPRHSLIQPIPIRFAANVDVRYDASLV